MSNDEKLAKLNQEMIDYLKLARSAFAMKEMYIVHFCDDKIAKIEKKIAKIKNSIK